MAPKISGHQQSVVKMRQETTSKKYYLKKNYQNHLSKNHQKLIKKHPSFTPPTFFHFHRTLSQEPHPQPGNLPNDDSGDWLECRPEGHGVLFRVLQTAPSDEDGTAGWFSLANLKGPQRAKKSRRENHGMMI